MRSAAVPFVRPICLRSRPGAGHDRKVTWLELFLDLGFVAAVAQVVAPLASDYSPTGVWRCALLFLPIWWAYGLGRSAQGAWSGQSTFATRFDTDDGVQRVLTLLQLFVVAVMAVNAGDAIGSRDTRGFLAAYAVLRAVLSLQYLRAATLDDARALALTYALGGGVAALLWVGTVALPGPAWVWWSAALAVDLLTPVLAERQSVEVPPDHAHLPERYGLFMLIMFGEALLAVMRGMGAQDGWSVEAAASAILSFATIFALWSWYFDRLDAAAARRVACARDVRAFRAWSFAHIPLALALALIGVGLEHAVRVATHARLDVVSGTLLGVALSLAVAALGVVAASAESPEGGWAPLRHVAAAVAAVVVGLEASALSPAVAIGLWAAVIGTQAWWPRAAAR